jgi:PTH1 family peptidyl-tRNA hydrolase
MRAQGTAAKIIVGLGNPGPQYRLTRHNAGARVLEALARKHGWVLKKSRFLRSLIAAGELFRTKIYLIVPQTYMNLSGEAVAACLNKKRLRPKDLLVVCDDVALPLGEMRFRAHGSAGGHNGLRSIIEHIKTDEFNRLRLGVGRDVAGAALADYVLAKFDTKEEPVVEEMTQTAICAMETWLETGIDKSMNLFNVKKK